MLGRTKPDRVCDNFIQAYIRLSLDKQMTIMLYNMDSVDYMCGYVTLICAHLIYPDYFVDAIVADTIYGDLR